MTDILFTANGASSTVLVSGELTSGMVGLPVRFSFDSDWDGLNIVAVFDGGGQRISVPLLTDMEAVLPWEVIAKANTRLRIGAEGRKSDGSVVIPTVWANAGYIKEGAVATDEEGNPPTPGIYDQIMAAIEAGKLQGKPGEDGVSPTVSVTEIEGGHRVTITDENGKQVFDVMDGKDGSDASVNIVDDLDTKDPNAALSANMGAVLREKIDTDLLSVQKKLQAEIKQRVKTVNGVAPDENGNVVVEVPEGGGGSGVTAAEKELILSLFKNTAYTADMSATISRLESLWSGSGDEPDEPVEPDIPDEPDVIMHNITKKLDGVSASNSATSVVDGASYVCNLTAHDGYTLDGAEVSVAMGGRDITSTAYSNGVINIASVTGDVDITVVAREILIYSVTNNLTGVTNSNAQTEVTEGDFYKAAISVDDGYILDSLTITMGGVDVTADVYGEGNILIPEVIGDIVITAVASLPEYVETVKAAPSAVNPYSGDSTSTKYGTFYNWQTYHSKRATEADVVLTIEIANNTENAISSVSAYAAPIEKTDTFLMKPQGGKNLFYAVQLFSGVTIQAGSKKTVTYTLKAGKHLIVAMPKNLECSVIGKLVVPDGYVNEYDWITSIVSGGGAWDWYSGNTTESTKVSTTYSAPKQISTLFEEETTLHVVLYRAEESQSGAGELKFGINSGTDKKLYNVIYFGAGSSLPVGATCEFEYTVPAGYYVVASSGTDIMYIEKV